MLRKQVLILLILLAGLGLAFWWQYPDENLKIVTCDVGQGDAILIMRGFSQVVIDGGANNLVLSCLGKHVPFYDRKIEMVILTHPQADHMTGLVDLMERYRVELFVANAVRVEGHVYQDLIGYMADKQVPVLTPKSGDMVNINALRWKFLWPEERVGGSNGWGEIMNGGGVGLPLEVSGVKVDDLNQISIVTRLEYGQFSALFTGDVTDSEELAMLAGGLIEEVVLLKVPHHGSKHSSTPGLLQAARPRLAVISVGSNNTFGHPASDTLMRLESLGAKVLRTDEVGDVEVVTDGQVFWLE
jgi:competence protein ComEC